MAAVFDVALEGLERTSGIVGASSNFSFSGWFYISGTPAAGTFRTFLYRGEDPATYTDFVWIGQNDTGALELAVSLINDVTGSTLAVGWHCLQYTYDTSTNTHAVYLDGATTPDITFVANIDGETYTHEYVGTDTYAADWDPTNAAYVREWDALLPTTALALERQSATPITTTNLWLDTPLEADPNDDSGNARNWTEVGTVSYTTQPTITWWFYVLNTGASYTPPAWEGGWDTDGTSTVAFDPIPYGNISTTASRAETSAVAVRVGISRMVSRRLAPQTISGTLNMVMGVNESNAAADFYTSLHAYVINADTDTVLGTLVNAYTESSGGGASEWTTTNTGRALQAAQTMSAVVVPNDGADYRLVVELGYSSENLSVTSRTGTLRVGARDATQDVLAPLTVGSTSTNTLAGYLSFSAGVALAAISVPNLTPETATALSTALPITVTQDTLIEGYAYAVWHRYTAIAGDEVIGAWAFGDLVTYRPTTTVFIGPLGSFVQLTTGVNVPLQFPVTPGTTYYLRTIPNSGSPSPATFDLSVLDSPQLAVPEGSLFVNDDSEGFPLVALSEADGTVLRFNVPFPAGEAGDFLTNKRFLVSDAYNGNLQLYDGSTAFPMTLLTTIAYDIGFSPAIRAQRTLNRFYVGKQSNPAVVKEYDEDGVELDTHTLTGNSSIDGIAANNDGTVLYHARGVSNPIKRWDLVNDVALTDFVAGVAGIIAGFDILVLADDTVIAAFTTQATGAVEVRHYQTDGTLLHTYAIAASSVFPAGTVPRLAYANDDPASFWIWIHLPVPETGVSQFQNVRVSDGTVLASLESPEYEVGSYQPTETATPLARFGNSYSCFFAILPSGAGPAPGGEGCPVSMPVGTGGGQACAPSMAPSR